MHDEKSLRIFFMYPFMAYQIFTINNIMVFKFNIIQFFIIIILVVV